MILPRALLLATTGLGLIPAAAWAGDDAAQSGASTDIVVTGTRASVAKATQIKRAANQIIDTVSASEIGQLPDFNAGDALRRVTGVNTLTYQGEPRFVIVRGFNQGYNDVLVDGFSLAATDINMGMTTTNGRQISMEVLPANLASHIDVIKSATPETEGNFIGGLVNFVTPSAFDFAKPTLSLSVKGGEALDSKANGGNHFGGQAEVAGATRFGSDQQFGLYLSGTYWRRDINVPQEETGSTRNWYTNAGTVTTPYGGNGYAVPANRIYYNYRNKRERFGSQGRLDWHGESAKAYIASYYFNQRENSTRYTTNAAVAATATDSNQTATSGTLSNVTQTQQLGRYLWKRQVYGLYGRGDVELGGGWNADLGASWSHSSVNNPQIADSFAQSNMAFNYDTSGIAPTFTAVNAANAANASLYKTTSRTMETYSLSSNRYDVQANIARNVGAQDRGFGIKAGARFSGTRQGVGYYGTTWSGLGYTLADVTNGSGICGYQCDTPIPMISGGAADSKFAQYAASATASVNTASNAGGTFKISEDIWAGYLQGQWRSDRLLVVGGVRLEQTRFASSSTQATNGAYAPVSASKSYFDALPSVNVIFNTTENSKLRLGASMSVARPAYSAAALHGGVLNTTSSTPTLSTGNPDLAPRRARNLDIAQEFYFDHGQGLFAVSGFYKWIENEIYSYGAYQTIAGVSTPVLVTQARNATGLTRAYGLEVSASHDLSFLPAPFDGFGVSANATFARAHVPITLSDGSVRVMNNLAEQPGRIINASLYYDKGRVHGRLAWNHLGRLWDDRYPNLTPSGFYANRIQQPTNNLDFQISYDVTRRFTVSFDAQNLTAQGMSYRYGASQELLQSAFKLPTQILFGAKVKL